MGQHRLRTGTKVSLNTLFTLLYCCWRRQAGAGEMAKEGGKLQRAGVGKRGKGVGGQHSGGGGSGCTRTISSAEVFLQCLPDELQSWERALPIHIQYHKYKFSLLCIVKK